MASSTEAEEVINLERRAADLLAGEELDDARDAARACLTIAPADRSCWEVVLFSYTRAGRLEEARPMLEECLADDPDDVLCLAAMVTQHATAGDLDSAEELADRLWDLAPDTTEAHLAYAVVADDSGDITAAVQEYEAACSNGQEYACVRAEHLRRRAQ